MGTVDINSWFQSVALIDEDDFTSNSDIKAPSQQSTKAYVDNIGGGGSTPSDEAYNEATWNGDIEAATKNVLRDKIELLDSDIQANVTKLSGIEENADVTDAANVASAGAIMTSDIGTTVLAPNGDGSNLTGILDPDTANEYTKTQNFNATVLTDAATIFWDASSNQVASVTLAGNRTLANPTNIKDGATYILIVKQDTTGNRTLSYGSNYKWPGGTIPTLTTDASAVDILTFISDGTDMYGVASLNFS